MEEVAQAAVLKAGEVIREAIGNGAMFGVEHKGPSDYVTDVDRKSEALIIGMIREHFPDHHIMAEESAKIALQPGFTWIIDPLDGTTNFIHGFPFVAISVALYLDREPLLGFVLDPLRGELFSARRGGGAYLNGKRIHISDVSKLEYALIATGFPFRSKAVLDPYLATFKSIFEKVSGIRRAGAAALDLAYVAAGRVDGFWEVGLAPWDVAAGGLLIMEAGGYVDDFWGRGDYLGTGHIVAGNPAVHPFLKEEMRTFLASALEPVVKSGRVDSHGIK